eukprot:g31698.t1
MMDASDCAVQPGQSCFVRCKAPYLGSPGIARCPDDNTDPWALVSWTDELPNCTLLTCPDPVKPTREPKGKAKGESKRRQTFLTDTVDEQPAEPEDEEQENDHQEEEAQESQEEPGDESEPGGEEEEEDIDADELSNALEVLTVTARRLQGLTLGRKYTGKRSLAERKRTSHCAVCGEKGHWKGDDVCPGAPAAPSTARGKASGKATGKGNKPGGGDSKKVFAVRFADGSVQSEQADSSEKFGAFFTFMTSHIEVPQSTMVPEVMTTKVEDYTGFMILDAACQRTCCSTLWLKQHVQHLRKFRLMIKDIPEEEAFQFGQGEPQHSHKRSYIPAGFDGATTTLCLIEASVLHDTKIPLLASNHLLESRLQATLDLPQQRLYSQALGIAIPIVKVCGHLAVQIDCFPSAVHESHVWQELTAPHVWLSPDPEFVLPDSFCGSQQFENFEIEDQRHAQEWSSTAMVASLAPDAPSDPQCGDDTRPLSSEDEETYDWDLVEYDG